MSTKVRINSVEIECFKNVSHGLVNLRCTENLHSGKSDILGIYGQNGSGKTAFINSLSILKNLLTGQQLPKDTIQFIMVKQKESRFKFEFVVYDKNDSDYTVSYQFTLRVIDSIDDTKNNTSAPIKAIAVVNEQLTYGGLIQGEKKNTQKLADSGSDTIPLIPQVKLNTLVGKNNDTINELIVSKKLAYRNSQSFLFSGSTQKLIRENCKDKTLISIFETLITYAHRYLFVVDTRDTGLISLDAALPFTFSVHNEKSLAFGSMLVRLDASSTISKTQYNMLSGIIKNMNTVLEKLVPGLNVGLENLGSQLMDNGESGIMVQLTSIRDGIKLPLKNESEGIKKIVSILQLLIGIYNNDSMTVAVDELDSGIFEYLLGEILKIIAESGKGQLFFTSHNLRPLETLDSRYICFTTTNPDNRYIRIDGIQNNNNLRSIYYRSILLGGQEEKLYDETNNYKIALAFNRAGDSCEE